MVALADFPSQNFAALGRSVAWRVSHSAERSGGAAAGGSCASQQGAGLGPAGACRLLRAPLLPSLVWVSETSAFFIYYYFFGARRALTAYLNGSIGALTLAAAVLFSTVRAQLGCGQPAASSAAQKTHRRDPRPAAAPASPSRPAGLLPPLPRPHMASPAPPARAVGSLPPLGNGARRGGGSGRHFRCRSRGAAQQRGRAGGEGRREKPSGAG